VVLRLAGPFVAVIAVRVEAGSGAALLAALLVALGAWLRVRMADATVGFAAFAGVVAVLGDASLWVVAIFWLLGARILLARSMVAGVRRRFARRSSLKTERTQPVSLGPES
jgi:thiol:disulfide interchange protein